MQRSEGGGLGVGGSPSGLMSARGAADFLTRATTILAILVVGLSIFLAILASVKHAPVEIDTSLSRTAPSAPASEVAPATGDPLARSEEHTSELQSLMRISYAVFCLKKKTKPQLINAGILVNNLLLHVLHYIICLLVLLVLSHSVFFHPDI